MRPIIYNIGFIPVRVAALNAAGQQGAFAQAVANVILPQQVESVSVGASSDNITESVVSVPKNTDLYFKVVTTQDASKLVMSFSGANWSETLLPTSPNVVKTGNTWIIYRPIKRAWASQTVSFKAVVGGMYSAINDTVTVVTF